MFGPYVYRGLTVVVVPRVAMEHSGLIMTPADEFVVAHELAHQWWYASVGNDQARAPWLDEAFAQWAGASVVLHRGRGVAPQGGDCPGARGDEPLVTRDMAFWAGRGDRYAGAVYFAGACLLDQLEAHLGRAGFQAALRAYSERHRMGWHTEADFKAAMDAAAGDDRLAPVWQRFGIDGVAARSERRIH